MAMTRRAATVDYNCPYCEYMSCIGNYVTQLKDYLVLLVYGSEMTIGHLKCLNRAKPRISSVDLARRLEAGGRTDNSTITDFSQDKGTSFLEFVSFKKLFTEVDKGRIQP